MIRRLTIQNYALIESLDIEFPSGLIIITGETGAGKSILLGALTLLLGGKSDNSLFANNDKNCVVEGEFTLDSDEYILRRVISPNGRSRFFLNDEPVSANELSQIANTLIDIHAQNRQFLFGDKRTQMDILDTFCSNQNLLKKYRAQYDKVNELRSEIEKLKNELSKFKSEREFMEFQFSKLEEANLQTGEFEALEIEEKTLANAENIKTTLANVLGVLDSEQFSLPQNLKESASQLGKISDYLPKVEELISRLDSSRLEIRDIIDELNSLYDSIDVSSVKLQQVQERLSLLYSLLKRYDKNDIDSLISFREQLREKLSIGELGSENIKEKEEELDLQTSKLENLAEELSERRTKGGEKFVKELQKQIVSLDLSDARFEIKLKRSQLLLPFGQDEIEFYFSANRGEKLIEIEKVASGGELSRVMLCIKKIMAQKVSMPTLIFDEIDAGVSGRIADKMGELLSQMGEKMQVIAITHLPQVASKGNSHLLVYKQFAEDKRAHTYIRKLSEKERVDEIARLLSGEKTSAEAIENARVLLRTI